MWSATASVPWPCSARWIRFPPEIGHAGGRPCSPKPERPGFISPFPPVLPSVPSPIHNPHRFPAKLPPSSRCALAKTGERWTASGIQVRWFHSFFVKSIAPAPRPPFAKLSPFLHGTGCKWKPRPLLLADRPGTRIGKAGQISGGYFSGFICRQGSGRKFRN